MLNGNYKNSQNILYIMLLHVSASPNFFPRQKKKKILDKFCLENGFGEAETYRRIIYKNVFTIFMIFIKHLPATNKLYYLWVFDFLRYSDINAEKVKISRLGYFCLYTQDVYPNNVNKM